MSTASETIDEAEEEAAPRPSLVLRLKRLLAAPALLLRRLRRPKEEAGGEEEAEARDARREESRDEAGAPAAPPLWRRLLPHGFVLLAGAVAGSSATYWHAAQAIDRQAAVLDEQQAEVARLKGLVAGYDKLVLQNRKKLEEAQSQRVALENRLAAAQADLMRQPVAAGRGAASAATHPGKTGDCTLRPGSIGGALKDCLSEFNRP